MEKRKAYPVAIKESFDHSNSHVIYNNFKIIHLMRNELSHCKSKILQARLSTFKEVNSGNTAPLFVVEGQIGCDRLKARMGEFGEDANFLKFFLKSLTLEQYLVMHGVTPPQPVVDCALKLY